MLLVNTCTIIRDAHWLPERHNNDNLHEGRATRGLLFLNTLSFISCFVFSFSFSFKLTETLSRRCAFFFFWPLIEVSYVSSLIQLSRGVNYV